MKFKSVASRKRYFAQLTYNQLKGSNKNSRFSDDGDIFTKKQMLRRVDDTFVEFRKHESDIPNNKGEKNSYANEYLHDIKQVK